MFSHVRSIPRLVFSAAPGSLTRSSLTRSNRSIVLLLSLFSTPPLLASSPSAFHPSDLTLVEEIDCAATPNPQFFEESAPGASVVQNLLGVPTRVLPPHADSRYFAYRIGADQGLVPGQAYVLQVDYPEDLPRSLYVIHRGTDTYRGFATGRALGDGLEGYLHSNPESLDLPLSHEFETWESLFYLHDRTAPVHLRRGVWYDPLNAEDFPLEPEDGFWVIIAQTLQSDMPVAHGAAVSKIRLYQVNQGVDLSVSLNLPPQGLPRRHLFFREEMADRIEEADTPNDRAVTDPIDYYEHKFKLMKFLGMNTFAKDLIEFAHNQGFDAQAYGGSSWWIEPHQKDRWQNLLQRIQSYDLSVLPYYEYAGSTGSQGLGTERRAEPLDDTVAHFPDYTATSWSETFNVDLTDPDTTVDFERLLEVTVVDYKDQVDFVGAWLRPRTSAMPISFSDSTRARYAGERAISVPSRGQLMSSPSQLADYKRWWQGKRADFLLNAKNYLDSQLGSDTTILMTTDPTEPGPRLPGGRHLVNDDPTFWQNHLPQYWTNTDIEWVTTNRIYRDAVLAELENWGTYEISHSAPQADPDNYALLPGVSLTYSFNRAYTVADPVALSYFEKPSQDSLALIRHHYLNEAQLVLKEDEDSFEADNIVGYLAADFERAGPFSMMSEALAVANANPRFIGYLAANNFTRGFPYYAQRFNRAFLSLPALPSERLEDAASHSRVVVRRIATETNGEYFAVVNTNWTATTSTVVEFGTTGKIWDAATDEYIGKDIDRVTIDLYPFELRTFRLLEGLGGSGLERPDVQLRFTDPVDSGQVSTLGNNSITIEAWVGLPDSEPQATEPPHLRITSSGSAWQSFRLGYDNGHIWGPAIDPTAGGNTQLELELRDFTGNQNWSSLSIGPQNGSRRPLSDYVDGQPTGWFTVTIPTADFGSGAFAGTAHLILPFTEDSGTVDLGIARVEFRGGSEPLLVFGEGSTANAWEDTPTLGGDFVPRPAGSGPWIESVSWYFDGQIIGRDTAPPFQVQWLPPQPGSYQLIAIARDTTGRIAQSQITVEALDILFAETFECQSLERWSSATP